MKNFLFICSKNQWRSPTAEAILRKNVLINVRSAGTSAKARRCVSFKDIEWADTIFVMEKKHKQRLQKKFTTLLDHKDIVILDIPDDYQYMDEALIELLEDCLAAYL
ncbi:MAG: phosphotyrosine protein phosphatase [Zetaproteobacteria bacterium]|nr:MAG: phosphotyrosine protein phosphatase [Zetaproteobacteria bacterium]